MTIFCCRYTIDSRELRLALASKISLGNKLLDLDLVPREEDGRPADPDQQGIAHIFNVVRIFLAYIGTEVQKSDLSSKI